MGMPGRKFTSGSGYRYGFNGKENDNEVKGEGAQQDYGFRISDPRVGRFLSIDPLTKQYPYYSPYHFAGNSPIKFIDLDGLEPATAGDKEIDKHRGTVDRVYKKSGGDKKFYTLPLAEEIGTEVPTKDKKDFVLNNLNDKYKRYVNESNQFVVTDESKINTEKDFVNFMLGNFAYGMGPENYFFPETSKFSQGLKTSNMVGEVLVHWSNQGKSDDFSEAWSMDARGQVNVFARNGNIINVENFLGTAHVNIRKVNSKEIEITIFNVTSITSGDLSKHLPGGEYIESRVRPTSLDYRVPYSNISQTFKIRMSTAEAGKLIKQFNPSGKSE
jgi:RHS repeat-associated protein